MTDRVTGDAFLKRLNREIPLTCHMGLSAPLWDGHNLEMPAALLPNVNDKGTGFGGAQVALATLCGWSLTTLWLEEQGIKAAVVVKDSQVEYLKPVTGDFTVVSHLPEADELASVLAQFEQRGRTRLRLQVEVRQGEKVASRLQGQYVAFLP
ncbi:YiiD C-terminal domain-containing protein [Pontibacter sp. JAM-7]|uniref:YiiD C-terminal domain-containing protein n=1 Tax=Pontibacter sp. JAM-7 TaxID=3366581 RepID=UPI003AF732BE